MSLYFTAVDKTCWNPGKCVDSDTPIGRLYMKSGRTVSANKCKDVCAVFGSVDCKTVSMDTDNSSCIIYDKPCSQLNTTCTGCLTWSGNCSLRYSQDETTTATGEKQTNQIYFERFESPICVIHRVFFVFLRKYRSQFSTKKQ